MSGSRSSTRRRGRFRNLVVAAKLRQRCSCCAAPGCCCGRCSLLETTTLDIARPDVLTLDFSLPTPGPGTPDPTGQESRCAVLRRRRARRQLTTGRMAAMEARCRMASPRSGRGRGRSAEPGDRRSRISTSGQGPTSRRWIFRASRVAFDGRDRATPVCLVSEAFVRRYLAGGIRSAFESLVEA